GNGCESALAQDLAQRRNLNLQIVLLDHEPGPNLGEQLVLREKRAGTIGERQEQVEGARAQRHRRPVREQRALGTPQLEPAEAASLVERRDGGSVGHAVNWWTRPPSSSFQWASAARHLSMIRRLEESAHARRAFGDKYRLAAGTSGDDDLLPRSTVAQEQPA